MLIEFKIHTLKFVLKITLKTIQQQKYCIIMKNQPQYTTAKKNFSQK